MARYTGCYPPIRGCELLFSAVTSKLTMASAKLWIHGHRWSVLVPATLGICLVLTPNFVLGSERLSWVLAGDGAAAAYCYLIGNQYMVFTLGIVSLYSATLMAIERWVAVFRVLSHKILFRLKKVRTYLAVVWLVSLAANSTHIIELKYDRLKSPRMAERCVVHPLMGHTARKLVGVVEVFVKFFIPTLIMFLTFAQLYIFMKRSATCPLRARSQLVLRRLTRMAALTAILMALCWMPNQLYYLLFKFNLVELNTRWHLATVILCMFNSCMNPCIFFLSNRVYRGALGDMLRRCWPCWRGKATLHSAADLSNHGAAPVKLITSAEQRVFHEGGNVEARREEDTQKVDQVDMTSKPMDEWRNIVSLSDVRFHEWKPA